MDVGEWLRGLGPDQYEEKFRDNKIDADVLLRLTADDLKDIGIRAVGDRRRLLDAISALAGAESSRCSGPSQNPHRPRVLHVSAERRPITVMFCDLVGSTGLAAQLDAEDWRDLVSEYLDQASAAVAGFRGHVLKRLGDGLMVLFGYPQAQENDAERAVRAALAIQRALGELNARNAATGTRELSARIGLELGPAVVDATGEVFGDAPNIASRVQAAAEPGWVLVTGNVQRQVAGLFVAEEQGAQNLRGSTLSDQSLSHSPGERRRLARRRSGADAIHRPRRGTRPLDPPLGACASGRGPSGADCRRAGHRQVAAPGPVPRKAWGSSAHLGRMERFAALEEHAAAPDRRMGPVPIGRGPAARATPRRSKKALLRLIGLDPVEYAPLIAPLVDIPLPPGSLPNFSPEETRRRQLTAIVAYALAGSRSEASRPCLRGSAMGRPDLARTHARARSAGGASALAPHQYHAARVSPAVEPAIAPQRDLAFAA